jgi:enoyl-CoA hydratase
LPVGAERALAMGLVHEVFPDDTFEEDVMTFCRHLAAQNGEQMGTAKIAIELARDVSSAQGRHVERLANSALMLHPDYLAAIQRHVEGIGGRN